MSRGDDIGELKMLAFCSFTVQTFQDSRRLSPIQFTPPDATKLDSFISIWRTVRTARERAIYLAAGGIVRPTLILRTLPGDDGLIMNIVGISEDKKLSRC